MLRPYCCFCPFYPCGRRKLLRSWQDNGDNPDWSFILNRNPIGTPSVTDNLVLGSLAAEDTIINQNFTIDTLAITNGDLTTPSTAGTHVLATTSTALIS